MVVCVDKDDEEEGGGKVRKLPETRSMLETEGDTDADELTALESPDIGEDAARGEEEEAEGEEGDVARWVGGGGGVMEVARSAAQSSKSCRSRKRSKFKSVDGREEKLPSSPSHASPSPPPASSPSPKSTVSLTPLTPLRTPAWVSAELSQPLGWVMGLAAKRGMSLEGVWGEG
jgi:hypothetical protein